MIITVDPAGAVSWTAVDGKTVRRRCALGKGGVRLDKREGDGATPAGSWELKRLLYRPDRLPEGIETVLPSAALTPTDGWCDDLAHADYNKPVTLPFPARHEVLWREDHVYDVIGVLGHNDDPPVPGLGSAVFLHVARPDYSPTEGCIALALPDLLELLRIAGPGTRFVVPPADGS